MRSDLAGQLELPGTVERPADLAHAKAAAPIMAPAPQKPCDFGLFGDTASQADLVDLSRRQRQ